MYTLHLCENSAHKKKNEKKNSVRARVGKGSGSRDYMFSSVAVWWYTGPIGYGITVP